MVVCFAPDCSHNNLRDTCRMYRFPRNRNSREYRNWINQIRRQDKEPTIHSVVCSCHFVDGKKENGPTLFVRNRHKYMQFNSPEKRKRIRALRESNNDTICEDINNEVATSVQQIQQPQQGISDPEEPVLPALREAENYFLLKSVQDLSALNTYKNCRFTFKDIQDKDNLVALYTGLPNSAIFTCILRLISQLKLQYYYDWKVKILEPEDQLLLTLMKLRMNCPLPDLALRFNCSTNCVANVFYTWLYALHKILFKTFMREVPSTTKNQSCLPSCFSPFTQCRMIIDCTEVRCEVPDSLELKRLLYSNYKHCHTFKGLLGVAPNGTVTYASSLYPGSTSDKSIVKHCGLLSIFKPGDLILADKGFVISDILPDGVTLNIPPFLTTSQFTPAQVTETSRIARARIHVERANARIKGYSILSFLPHSLFPHASVIWQTVAALINLQNPLIAEMKMFLRPECS